MTIDRTTFDSPVQKPASSGPRAWLTVAEGPASPAKVDLPVGVEVPIGRSRSSALHIDDNAVSRTHASLRWDGGGTVTLTDYGSRNGTLLDGRRVRGTARIASGSELRIGAAALVVVIGGVAEPSVSSIEAFENDELLARDRRMLRVLGLVDRAAKTDSTVLLSGETGTGKEVVARRIHALSRRGSGPFVAINCGAVPEGVAESTFFGVEKGAFTGASERRPGVFAAATGGTLFLDEVGELSIASQARLLRVLAEHTVRPVGAVDSIEVDVRVIAATNRGLDAMVAAGAFRADLLYRLNVVHIDIPPLRERMDDILPLAERFLARLDPRVRLAPDAVAALRAHDWPGNVRELENAMERAAALADEGVIRAPHLASLREDAESAAPGGLRRHVDDAERRAIEEALSACRGNQTQAAARLGISRRALIYRMEKLGLKPPPPSERR